ncbi:helix-turn-helix transcriptional regulator [Rhizohabitans arisaemae]|uniref:helix-turn-helix transcriptional regulator n=1 Tax=Rhizohabitans arisaemae TaxID=2720610 RepID=UPI0024B14E4A|nr:helix-turn-helix transcriptional regulator [Rhizohabitans arisaemae]
MEYAVGALVDIDDYVVQSRARGPQWASAQLERAEHAIREVTGCDRLPADEWLVVLTGPDPDRLTRRATALAEEVRARIGRAGNLTATVSLGRPGPRAESEAEARRTNSYKLLLGGDRVITAPAWDDHRVGPPVRIEAELARAVQTGDRRAAAGLLASWVDRCAQERDLDPRALHRWLVGELLFIVDVANRRRLADGSTDWVDACERLPVSELMAVSTIHERSYLRIWLEETLVGIVPRASRTDRNILSTAESYMAAHYADPGLRLSTVAEAVSASPYYISHLFAKERRTTFLRQLTALRLRHARALLTTSTLPVDTVAVRSGYHSAKAFRGVFKRHVGCSPSEYRQSYRPEP